MAANLSKLDTYLDGVTLTAELEVLVELARTLAVQMDESPSALMAAEYRKTLDVLAAALGAEDDEHAATVVLLSEVGDQAG